MQSQQFHSEIIEVIIHNLNCWRENKQPTYIPANILLNKAVKEQRNIGWNHFIEGFWSKHFELCQQSHFESIKTTKSTVLLLSKTQRRIWRIAWQLWNHRNNILHDSNHSFHPQELEQINQEIHHEWTINLSTLPSSYNYLFKDTLQIILNKTHTNKLNWLITVWTIRELYDNGYLLDNNTEYTDTLTRYRYLKWKQKL